jgi:hypothetical protein
MKIVLFFDNCRTQATPQSLWLKPSLAIMLKSAFAQELASAELGGRQFLVSAATALKEGSEDGITHRTTVQVTSAVITPPASFSSHIPDHLSPRTDAVSPRREAVSPSREAVSPRTDAVSPRREAVSPRSDAVSPRFEAVSPRLEAVSPSAETVSLPYKLVLGLASTPLAVVAPFQALNSTLVEIFPQPVSGISQPPLLTTNRSKQYQIKSKKHQLSPEIQQENPQPAPPPPKHYQDSHVKPHHRQQRHDEQQQQQHRDQQQQQHRDQQQQQQHRDQQQQQQHRDQQQQQQHRDEQQQQQHLDQQHRLSSSLRNDLDLSMRIFDEDIVRKDSGLVINLEKKFT